MLVKINVTQEDIDKGIVNCYSCPITLAAKRVIKNYYFTTFTRAYVLPNTCYSLPLSARLFIIKFDRNKKSVKPFSFELEIDNASTI